MEASIVWCGAGGFRALSLIPPLIYRSKWLLSCDLWGGLVASHRLESLEKREALSDSLYTLLCPVAGYSRRLCLGPSTPERGPVVQYASKNMHTTVRMVLDMPILHVAIRTSFRFFNVHI